MSEQKTNETYTIPKLSIGIVSCGRPVQLARLFKSFENIVIDVDYEVVFLENFGRETAVTLDLMNREKIKHPRFKSCILNCNVGFFAAWNILVHLMEGDYHLMTQDDMEFVKLSTAAKISDVLSYMHSKHFRVMNLNGHNRYTDHLHVEDRTLRMEIGDYVCFPRKFRSMREQGGNGEPDFERRLQPGMLGAYHLKLGGSQYSGNSLMQTCIHETPKGLSPEQIEQIWREHNFQKHGMKIWA